MRRNQWIALVGIIIIGVLLAFPMRDAVHQIIVIPLAYIFWVLGLFYRSYSQVIIWAIFVTVTLLFLLGSLLGRERRRKVEKIPEHSFEGPIEDFSILLSKVRKGMYYRWIVANRLAKLARDLLAQREGLEPRDVQQNHLTGRDWSPPRDVDIYFQSGLFDSFSSFPRQRWWFFKHAEPTPLDLDVEEAVEFLEGQMRTTEKRN